MQRSEYVVCGNLRLPRGSALRIDDGREMNVCPWTGSLWITQERENRDVILEAGQWFRIEREGLTLVQALEDSAVALTSPHEDASAKSIQVVRTGTVVPKRPYQPLPDWRSTAAALKAKFTNLRAEILGVLVRLG